MNAFAKAAESFRRALARSTLQPAASEVLLSPPKPMVGLFSALTAEQKRSALTYAGNHNFGSDADLLNGKPCI